MLAEFTALSNTHKGKDKSENADEYKSLESIYQQMEKEDSEFIKLSKKDGQIVQDRERFIVHKINVKYHQIFFLI